MASDDDFSTAGWDAIDAALARVHGDQEPKHYGTVLKWMLGGPDPLDGISAYMVDEPRPHWHLVGYGLSELYDKSTDDPAESGFGFELTLRLARPAGEDAPPMWALNFMQNLARYVFTTGNVFAAGHHMDLNGPIALGSDTALRAAVFAEDPRLPPIDTPNGRLAFVQIVGITSDELDAVMRWDCSKFLEVLAAQHPLLITDLARRSILDDPALRACVEAGIETDGSSVGAVFVGGREDGLEWRPGTPPTLVVGAKHVPSLQALLRGRTRRGEEFFLIGKQHQLHVTPADRADATFEPGEPATIEVQLPIAVGLELARSLAPRRGTYSAPGAPFAVEVVPTTITDRDGEVVEVVG